MLEGLYRISERTGKPYYGAAALVGNIFAQQKQEEAERKADLEKCKQLIYELGYLPREEG